MLQYIRDRFVIALSSFFVLAGTSGCAVPWPDDLPGDFRPVVGTVTLDGKPLPHVIVTFVPTSEGAVICTGETDDAGRYRLSYNSVAGAVAGEYRVLLTYRTTPKGKPITVAMNSSLLVPLEVSQAIERLPEKYTMETSALKAKVEAGENVIDFALEGPLRELPIGEK